MRQLSSFSLLLSLTFFAGHALADVPPPPGYVEQCTPEKQQKPGETCEVCTGAYYGEPDKCDRSHGVMGFTRRCKTRGASVWSEVWCKGAAEGGDTPTTAEEPKPAAEEPKPAQTGGEQAPAEAPKPAAQAPAASSGSSCAAGGLHGAWALALIAIGWMVRRRREA